MSRPLAIALPALLLAFAVGGFAGRAYATPFDAARVPVDSAGVGHLDVDGLRATALFTGIRTLVAKRGLMTSLPAVQRKIAEMLLGETRAVTFWVGDGDTGAMIIEVADGARFEALAALVPFDKKATIAGHPARRYKHDAADKDPSWTARVGNLVVVADDEPSLRRTFAVLDGKARNLVGRRLGGGARPAGVFFFAALGDRLLDEVKKVAASKTLQVDMTSLTVELGEVAATLQGRVVAEVGTPADAQQIKSVVEGVRALVSLADDEHALKPLLDAVAVTANGKQVAVTLAVPSATLLEALAHESTDVMAVHPAEVRSDEALAVDARGGDAAAFDELVTRLRPPLTRFLARRLARPDDADDVVQETFLRAHRALDRYDPGQRFATWLFAIGKNVAATHREREVRRSEREARGASASTVAGAEPAGELWQVAQRVLGDEAYRALWLRYAQELSVDQVARSLGRTSITTKVMLFRARKKLLVEVTR